MRKRDLTVGIFLIAGVVLFSVSIFLIGSQRKTFSPSFEVFAAFADLDGLMKGARVQVGGSVAGEVTHIVVPESPGAPFCLRLRIEERFHSIVRADSVAVISTEGIIGDKFVQIRPGERPGGRDNSGIDGPGQSCRRYERDDGEERETPRRDKRHDYDNQP
ncbi:MAG: hypothetical protein C5B47_02055 [Verrucomicrobia bacterium]|nr:MAG: hypothetical protein C5B47_02055 [Verrucomicrobiota bacterium]